MLKKYRCSQQWIRKPLVCTLACEPITQDKPKIYKRRPKSWTTSFAFIQNTYINLFESSHRAQEAAKDTTNEAHREPRNLICTLRQERWRGVEDTWGIHQCSPKHIRRVVLASRISLFPSNKRGRHLPTFPVTRIFAPADRMLKFWVQV